MSLQMTGLGHACVRLVADGTTIVVDPGAFSDPDALDGANVVLVTHEHFDHVVPDRLRAAAAANPDLEVWTNPALAAQFADLGGRVHAVTHGDTFTVGGLDVHVHGEKHAVIHRDIPIIDNVGFLFPGGIFHPGDALTVPDERVETLLLPTGAPWSKVAELIDYAREVNAPTAYMIHTALLSETGLGFHKNLLSTLTPGTVESLAEAGTLTL